MKYLILGIIIVVIACGPVSTPTPEPTATRQPTPTQPATIVMSTVTPQPTPTQPATKEPPWSCKIVPNFIQVVGEEPILVPEEQCFDNRTGERIK